MGLAYDANKVLKLPSNKKTILQSVKKLSTNSSEDEEEEAEVEKVGNKKIPKKIHVALELEAEARAPRVRLFRLPQNQVNFLTYLMDKYADDYEAMARDKKNYYQLTWKQIRGKINVFKGIPEQYAEYLVKKGEIVLDDPEPLEITKKKIAEDNFKKFNTPQPGSKRQLKKERKQMKEKVGWIEENVDNDHDSNDEFNYAGADKLEDVEGKTEGGKKIKLFSDDEDEDEEEEEAKPKKMRKEKKIIEEVLSDDSTDADLEDDDDDDGGEFKNLSDLSDEEISEDDLEFSSDSDE